MYKYCKETHKRMRAGEGERAVKISQWNTSLLKVTTFNKGNNILS